jgi:SpoVK/Ycf46/Vps4 family AAA+-type ATPase
MTAGMPPREIASPWMAGRELKQLFRAYREGDELAFRRAAQEIISDEEAKNHLALARDLRRIIAGGAQAAFAESVTLPTPPTDREGEWPLADIRHPEHTFAELVLSARLERRVRGLVEEFSHWNDLDQHGIPRRQRILFHGPAGCGKTSVAEAIAAEAGLPLIVVRLDAVVSSYLGETASNLHRIFDFARGGSWVILFDEFDALGKARDDPSEHGEIKRVITAFLQMLDSFRGASLVIAATNHEQLLDPALWRRFDEVLEFPRPTLAQARGLLRLRLRQTRHPGVNLDRAAAQLKGLPHAAIEKAAWDARRRALLDGRDRVGAADLQAAVHDVRARPW